ncbi:MAG: hypothetical protein ACK5XN_35355, partial [Bacteroidota bacterium]
MTNMYAGNDLGDGTYGSQYQTGAKAPVFGGSLTGIIAGAINGAKQEYNPVTPLPTVYQDTQDQGGVLMQNQRPNGQTQSRGGQQGGGSTVAPRSSYGAPGWSGQSNLGTSVYNPVSTAAPRNMYTGQEIPYDSATLASNAAGLAAERERAAKWGNGGPASQTNSGAGGPVFGGSTSGSTSNPQGGGLIASATGLQSWQVDPSQTVEGRASGIIGKDSALMQQARGYANQRANERGLINSSLAVQSAQDAVIGRATDIAKQDAATFADAGKFNTNQANSWNLAQQELEQKGSQFDRDLAQRGSQFDQNLASQNRQFDAELITKNRQFDEDLKYRYDIVRMNNDNNTAMKALENKYQAELQNDAAFNTQYRAYVDALYSIDSNKDLGSEAKLARKFEQAQILEDY